MTNERGYSPLTLASPATGSPPLRRPLRDKNGTQQVRGTVLLLTVFFSLVYSHSLFAQSSFGGGNGLINPTVNGSGCITTGVAMLKGNGVGGCTIAVSGSDFAPAPSGTSILKGNGTGGFSNAMSGTDYAPATSGTSVLKGNGTGGFSNATSGTDYAPPTSGSSVLKGNGAGGFTNAVGGTDFLIPGNNLSDASNLQVSLQNLRQGCGGLYCYYVDNNLGNDLNPGTYGAPWKSLTNVQGLLNSGNILPGTWFLFRRGVTWTASASNSPMITIPSGTNGTSANPIVFTWYGSGEERPVFDGNNGTATACFYGRATGTGSSPIFSYITINGFECLHTSRVGIYLYQNAGGTAGMPGIVFENNHIHNTGNGCYNTTGICNTGVDSDSLLGCGTYCNQLHFLDENEASSGVQFLNNWVHDCGGHNCMQVHGDHGGPLIQGNQCYDWVHNCIDVKHSVNALVTKNQCFDNNGGGGTCFYYENSGSGARGSITWTLNTVWSAPNGIQCEGGTSFGTDCKAYNNSLFLGDSTSAIVSCQPSTACPGSGSLAPSWDVRNNIFDTSAPLFVCNAQNTNSCGDIATWDYNGNGGKTGGAPTVSGLTGMSGKGAHDINNVDPKYIYTGGQIFNLKSSSSYIGTGQSGLTSNNNIGAY